MKFLELIILGILIVACSEVRFESPQPKNVKEITKFPQKFIGIFSDNENKDTLFISENGFRYGEDIKRLPDERVVLKKTGDYYILSCKEILLGDDTTDLKGWDVLPFKMVDDTLIVFYIDISDNDETMKTRFETILAKGIKEEIEKRDNDDFEYYLINPSKREFKTMLRDGLFNEQVKFTKIN
ncbi:hypothetical protein ACT3CD_13455 [Geofilum sp. OHC36d9]|uniref:hypothetical protein n=1 Tax=Geofilum sp. OHC36d9 TaxID=3458413 RepID=UPI0040349748